MGFSQLLDIEKGFRTETFRGPFSFAVSPLSGELIYALRFTRYTRRRAALRLRPLVIACATADSKILKEIRQGVDEKLSKLGGHSFVDDYGRASGDTPNRRNFSSALIG